MATNPVQARYGAKVGRALVLYRELQAAEKRAERKRRELHAAVVRLSSEEAAEYAHVTEAQGAA